MTGSDVSETDDAASFGQRRPNVRYGQPPPAVALKIWTKDLLEHLAWLATDDGIEMMLDSGYQLDSVSSAMIAMVLERSVEVRDSNPAQILHSSALKFNGAEDVSMGEAIRALSRIVERSP